MKIYRMAQPVQQAPIDQNTITLFVQRLDKANIDTQAAIVELQKFGITISGPILAHLIKGDTGPLNDIGQAIKNISNVNTVFTPANIIKMALNNTGSINAAAELLEKSVSLLRDFNINVETIANNSLGGEIDTGNILSLFQNIINSIQLLNPIVQLMAVSGTGYDLPNMAQQLIDGNITQISAKIQADFAKNQNIAQPKPKA